MLVQEVIQIITLVFLASTPATLAHDQAIFASQALMEVEWKSAQLPDLSFPKIHEFENFTASYLHNQMVISLDDDESLLYEQEFFLNTRLNVRNFDSASDSTFYLEAIVDTQYIGSHGIEELATILIQLTRNDIFNGLETKLNEILGDNVTDISTNFRIHGTTKEMYELGDHSHGKNLADQSLILVCSVLCGSLVFVTAVLMFVVGGWRNLHRTVEEQIEYLKEHTGTKDDSELSSDESDDKEGESTNVEEPPSETGSRHPAVELGMSRTPERMITESEYMNTPYSDTTEFTETTDITRPPLGITSMRKMARDQTLTVHGGFPSLTYQQ